MKARPSAGRGLAALSRTWPRRDLVEALRQRLGLECLESDVSHDGRRTVRQRTGTPGSTHSISYSRLAPSSAVLPDGS